jgi:hypothetical protein
MPNVSISGSDRTEPVRYAAGMLQTTSTLVIRSSKKNVPTETIISFTNFAEFEVFVLSGAISLPVIDL